MLSFPPFSLKLVLDDSFICSQPLVSIIFQQQAVPLTFLPSGYTTDIFRVSPLLIMARRMRPYFHQCLQELSLRIQHLMEKRQETRGIFLALSFPFTPQTSSWGGLMPHNEKSRVQVSVQMASGNSSSRFSHPRWTTLAECYSRGKQPSRCWADTSSTSSWLVETILAKANENCNPTYWESHILSNFIGIKTKTHSVACEALEHWCAVKIGFITGPGRRSSCRRVLTELIILLRTPQLSNVCSRTFMKWMKLTHGVGWGDGHRFSTHILLHATTANSCVQKLLLSFMQLHFKLQQTGREAEDFCTQATQGEVS